MRLSARCGMLCALALVSACGQRVGNACDENMARTIVYDQGGSPAYAGQALLITSCAGGGSFCHADSAMRRYGAPFGMNFDPTLADGARFPDHATGANHLYQAQVASHHLRDDIYSQVVGGQMPPTGVGNETMTPAYRIYASATDTVGQELPSIRSADGREMLRNWLACGSPVVEATTDPLPVACTTNADCTLTHRCDTTQHECFGVGAIVPARAVTMPHWSSIYSTVLEPTCALSVCHGAAGAGVSGNLDLSSSATAYAALVGVSSSIPVCGTRIVAGDPSMSAFFHKLEGTQDPLNCGATMPIGNMLSAAQLDIIRTWITNGALMD